MHATKRAPISELPDRLVSLEIAGEYLDVSSRTVRRMISRGEIEGVRVGPRLVRVREDHVLALRQNVIPAADSL